MPDFTMEVMQMCASIDGPRLLKVGDYEVSGLFSERAPPQCNCKAFLYSAPRARQGKTCKHIKAAEESVCGWHQQTGPESQTEEQRKEMQCPRCGEPSVCVQVAV